MPELVMPDHAMADAVVAAVSNAAAVATMVSAVTAMAAVGHAA